MVDIGTVRVRHSTTGNCLRFNFITQKRQAELRISPSKPLTDAGVKLPGAIAGSLPVNATERDATQD